MKLTREKCLEALDYILNKKVVILTMKGERILKQLIAEHFDNPPLKFEELHGNMWIWDNEVSEYKYIYTYDDWHECYLLNVTDSIFQEQLYEDGFEPNRYYRKQVV